MLHSDWPLPGDSQLPPETISFEAGSRYSYSRTLVLENSYKLVHSAALPRLCSVPCAFCSESEGAAAIA